MTERRRYHTVSVHPFRRTARQARNRIQAKIDTVDRIDGMVRAGDERFELSEYGLKIAREQALRQLDLPGWVRGVHVAKAGRLQWEVVVTSWRDRR